MTEDTRGKGEEKAIIKAVDMTDEMQNTVIDLAMSAIRRYSVEKDIVEKDIAATIKKELDLRYGVAWHCIVGRNFGSYVTHESKHFIYFYVGPLAVLAYKTS